MPTTPAGVRPLHRQPRRPRSRHHRIPDSDRSNVNTPDLNAATEAVAVAREVCRKAAGHLAELSSEDGRISVGKLDRHQVLAYDLAHAPAGLAGAAVMCDYGNDPGAHARPGPPACSPPRPSPTSWRSSAGGRGSGASPPWTSPPPASSSTPT